MKRTERHCSCKQILKLSGSNLNLGVGGWLCWVRFNCVRFEVIITVTMKNTPHSLHRSLLTFQSNMLLPHTGSKLKSRKQTKKRQAACLFPGLTLQFWNKSNMFLWNADKFLPDYMASHPGRQLPLRFSLLQSLLSTPETVFSLSIEDVSSQERRLNWL
jgi:hypothetical protein